MKRIIVADVRSNSINGISTGHYVPVAAMYKRILSNINEVKIAGGPVYTQYFKEDELLHLPYNVCHTSLLGRLKVFLNCRKLFQEGRNDVVVLQQSATITVIMYLAMFYRRTSRLYMILYSNEGLRNRIGQIFYGLAKKKIDGVICPNKMIGALYDRPYCLVTDYIYTGELSALPSVPFRKKQYDLCIVGRIAPEKGVIESAKKIAGTPYRMIIAGRPEDEAMANELCAVCDGVNNITLKLGYVSDEDFKKYIINSKYAFLNYQGEYSKRSSGVVYDTIFLDVPVIGCRCSAFRFIEEENLGYVYNSLDSFDLSILSDENLYDSYVKAISHYKGKNMQYITKLQVFLNTVK